MIITPDNLDAFNRLYFDAYPDLCALCGQHPGGADCEMHEEFASCSHCGGDHEDGDCPEHLQAMAEKRRDERMESAVIEAGITVEVNRYR